MKKEKQIKKQLLLEKKKDFLGLRKLWDSVGLFFKVENGKAFIKYEEEIEKCNSED